MSDEKNDNLVDVGASLDIAKGASAHLKLGAKLSNAIASMVMYLAPDWYLHTHRKLELGKAQTAFDAKEIAAGRAQHLTPIIVNDLYRAAARKEEVAQLAAEELAPDLPKLLGEGGGEPQVQDVDEAWLNAFWDGVGLVGESDEFAKRVYAKILAGKARSPRSCSMATLRVLRYMDQETAEAFRRLVPLVVGGFCFPYDVPLLKRYGLSYDDVWLLQQAGIFSSHGYELTEETLFSHGKQLLLVRGPSAKKVNLYFLDRPGRDLLKVAEKPKINEGYFWDFAHWLKTQAPSFEFLVASALEGQVTAQPADFKPLTGPPVTSPGSQPASTEPDPTDPPSESESPPQPE